jgi:hypothetical protein
MIIASVIQGGLNGSVGVAVVAARYGGIKSDKIRGKCSLSW